MKEKSILSHCDLDLWLKVTNFNSVWASAVSNHLAKTAFKSVHLFGWNFVHKQSRTHTHTHRHTHTDKLQWKYNPSMILWGCKKRKGVFQPVISWTLYNITILFIFFTGAVRDTITSGKRWQTVACYMNRSQLKHLGTKRLIKIHSKCKDFMIL